MAHNLNCQNSSNCSNHSLFDEIYKDINEFESLLKKAEEAIPRIFRKKLESDINNVQNLITRLRNNVIQIHQNLKSKEGE